MLDKATIKMNQDAIDKIGDGPCVAFTLIELAVPGQAIVQVLHRGTFKECQQVIEASESPCGYGQIPMIKEARGGVVTAEQWQKQMDADEVARSANKIDLSQFVLAPADQSIIN